MSDGKKGSLGHPRTRFDLRRWRNGGSMLPLVQKLIDGGNPEEASTMARLALADPECKDRAELEQALHDCASLPAGWLPHLEDFARNPSKERWDELLDFIPEEVFYNRIRDTTQTLMRLGCDGDVLFQCVSESGGMTPDLFDLAASGKVDPVTIERRGWGSPSRPVWLGLAAMAAQALGDRFAILRYLREACSDESLSFYAWPAIEHVRRAGDQSLNDELDRLGIPNP